MMFPIRSLTPQQATGNALAAGFNTWNMREDRMIIKKYARILLCFSFIVLFFSYHSEAASGVQHACSPGEYKTHVPQMVGGGSEDIGLAHVSYAMAKAGSADNGKTNTRRRGQKIKIGIIEFQSLNEEAKKDILGKVFSEVLTTSFVNSDAFKIIEREHIEKVVKELQLTQSGIVDPSSAKQIGKMVGADAILTGSVIKFGNDMRVDARIIEVESGIILTAEKAMGKSDLKSIGTMADVMVQNLVNKFYRDTQ
jgi:TolB-like protein